MSRVIVITIVLFACAGVRAADSQPASAPTYPADTPRNALKSLRLALREGDAGAIRDIFIARDQPGVRLISAMADNAAALVALHQAAEKAYGSDGANLVTGDINAESIAALSAIDKAEIQVNADSAIVRYPGATDPPIKLTKFGGRWKIPVTQLMDDASRTAQDRGTAELSHQATLAREMAGQISNGQIREGASRAREIWRSRLLAPISSTQPTTKPA